MEWLATEWFTFKASIAEANIISRDALHVFAGVGGQLLLAALLRRSAASLLPWLLVLLATGANEWFDYRYETWPDQWKETLKDFGTTMAVPSLLLLLSRFAPQTL